MCVSLSMYLLHVLLFMRQLSIVCVCVFCAALTAAYAVIAACDVRTDAAECVASRTANIAARGSMCALVGCAA